MRQEKQAQRNPWAWVPSLYLAEGAPYVMAMTVSVILYKRLGVSNTDIALYTSWLYLPWVIKPLWSPFVDMFRTKRFWIVAMQLLIGASFACVALTIPAPGFVRYTLAFFWIMAFSSATHDIAADGFYMLGLKEHQQAAFIGVRTIFYRIAMIAAKGILVVLAGTLEQRGFSVQSAWSVTFFLLAAIMLALFLYHLFVLPYPAADRAVTRDLSRSRSAEFFRGFVLFFRRKDILAVLAFFLFYRFAEAQLVKMVAPFLLDPRTKGGLGLSTAEVGIVYGTVGAVALMLGGLLGGWVISPHGLKRWLWIMVFAMHLPDAIFIWLSRAMPERPASDQHRRGDRAVRLRVRVHGLLAGHDHGLRGGVQDGPLRDRDGDHGPRDDAPGDVFRLAPGADGVSPLLPLDTALDDPRFHRDGDDPDRSGVRERGIGRQPYLLDTQDASRYPQTTQKQVKYGIFNDEK